MKCPSTTPIFLEGSKVTMLRDIALFKEVKTCSMFHFVHRYGYIDEFEA